MPKASVYTDIEKAFRDQADKVPTDGTEMAASVHAEYYPILQKIAGFLDDDIAEHSLYAGFNHAKETAKTSFNAGATIFKDALIGTADGVKAGHERARTIK